MKRTLLTVLVFGMLSCGLWGCMARTTSAPATSTATILTGPTSAPTPALTALMLATAAVTHTLQLTTTTALNIRAGPGLQYPVLGVFAANAGAEIIGRAADAIWWRVACPPGLDDFECWVINDETLLVVTGTGNAPVLPAPPVPPTATPIPTSTPTPCVVAAPAGWIQYPVRGGDTLFAISQRTGATVEQLRAVNCLLSDTIIAGDTLLAPSNFGQQLGGNVVPPITPIPQPMATPLPLPTAGVAMVLRHINPGGEGCPLVGVTPHLFIVGITEVLEQRRWELGEKFYICALGFATATPVMPVAIKVVRPDTTEQTQNFHPRRARWTWVTLPDDPLGVYAVTATQGITTVTTVFTVTLPSQPHLLSLLEETAAPGETIPFVVAGLRPGQPLYLYRHQVDQGEWVLVRSLAPALPGAQRATNYEVLTLPSDPPGRYLVHTGEVITIDTLNGPNMFVLQ